MTMYIFSNLFFDMTKISVQCTVIYMEYVVSYYNAILQCKMNSCLVVLVH